MKHQLILERKTKNLKKIIKSKIKNKKGLFYIDSEKEKNLYFSNNKNEKQVRQKNEFIEKLYKKTKYAFTKPNQVTSIGTSLIPFLEHNDGNRSLMGSNMQKQAIPIAKNEKPLIETGNETKISMESSSITRAKNCGLIKYISKNKIIVQEEIKKSIKINNDSLQGKEKKNLTKNMKTTRKKNIFKKRTYKIGKEETNNQNIYTKQQIVIKKKNWIKKGTLLTENTHIKNGRLCLGKNLLTAYIPIEGYNFEDAIVINKKLIEQKSFMSMHIKKYINFIINNEMGKVRKLKLIIKNKKAKIKIELKLKRKY